MLLILCYSQKMPVLIGFLSRHRFIGNGEVESSILSRSTSYFNEIKGWGAKHSIFPTERSAKNPLDFPKHLGKIRGAVRPLFWLQPCCLAFSSTRRFDARAPPDASLKRKTPAGVNASEGFERGRKARPLR